jgi:hypothetical protein
MRASGACEAPGAGPKTASVSDEDAVEDDNRLWPLGFGITNVFGLYRCAVACGYLSELAGWCALRPASSDVLHQWVSKGRARSRNSS